MSHPAVNVSATSPVPRPPLDIYILYPISLTDSTISINFVDTAPKSKGYDMLVVVTDCLTGYVKLKATLQTTTGKDIAELSIALGSDNLVSPIPLYLTTTSFFSVSSGRNYTDFFRHTFESSSIKFEHE